MEVPLRKILSRSTVYRANILFSTLTSVIVEDNDINIKSKHLKSSYIQRNLDHCTGVRKWNRSQSKLIPEHGVTVRKINK